MSKLIKALSLSFVLVLALTTSVKAQSPKASTTPKFEIITPSEDQTIYGTTIPILFNVEGFEIVDYNVNKATTAGQGHIHVWLDNTNPTAETATKVIEDTYTIPDVPYGKHTLVAEFVGNNHTSLKPPQKITVTFNSDQVASAEAAQYSGFDKKTAFVILVVVALVIIAAWWYTKDEDEEEMATEQEKPKKKATKRKTSKKKK